MFHSAADDCHYTSSTMSKNYNDLTDEEVGELFMNSIPECAQFNWYKTKGFRIMKRFEEFEKQIQDLSVYDDDVWITSYPKSGTTWLSEMVWSICNDIKSQDADKMIDLRVRFLEYESLFTPDKVINYAKNAVENVEKMPRPRFIKSHLPFSLLPTELNTFAKRPRVIHVMRNPKDVAVSFFHHFKLFRKFSGSAELFFEAFMRNIAVYAPYMDNVYSYWQHRNEPNVLLLKFEDMKSDMRGVIQNIAAFLNVEIDDEKMAKLMERLSFETMKKNEDKYLDNVAKYMNNTYFDGKCNGNFLRKGEIGAHKKEMNADYVRKFDELIEEAKKRGLEF